MKIKDLHPWQITPKEAVKLQKKLIQDLKAAPSNPFRLKDLKTVAGVDISYSKTDNRLFALIVVFTYPSMEIIDTQNASCPSTFPYVPGLLSFREGPISLEAFKRLEKLPDVVIFDGQGIAHPRGLGLASHMGLILGIPTIGCAKTRLVGDYKEPKTVRGSFSPLLYKNKTVGSVLRTKTGVKPVFVSQGAYIDLPSARKIVLACSGKYRIPEPTRLAHIQANKLRSKPETK